MADCGLMLILDKETAKGGNLAAIAAMALEGGARCIQMRDKGSGGADALKTALELRSVTEGAGCLLIINNHPHIAVDSGADGVHLGQDDMPCEEARKVLGPKRIVGLSTHSIVQAREAEAKGADYIGIGPVFATGTKPGAEPIGPAAAKEVIGAVRIPVFCIGGIDIRRAGLLRGLGAGGVAAASSIMNSGDITKYTRRMKEALRH